jgi:hypothetical protein
MKKGVYLAAILCVILAGVFFQLCHVREPLTGDGSFFIGLVDEMLGVRDYAYIDLPHGLGIWHPMLYQLILALIGRVFGPELLYFRIFGMVLFVANTLLVCAVASRVSERPFFSAVPAMACALFALNPLGVSLGIHIDIDNSILTTAMLLFLLAFVSTTETPAVKRIPLLSACFALTLLAKLTTPLVLIAALFIYFSLSGSWRRAVSYSAGVFVLGTAIFSAVWLVISRAMGYPFLSVFTRIVSVFFEKAAASPGMMERGRLALSVLYFITPPLLLLFAYVTARVILDREKDTERPIVYVAIVGALILIGYFFVGGLTYGVTKYQYPAVPMLAVVCAAGVARYTGPPAGNGHAIVIFGAAAVSAVLCFLVGDPILHLNYDYKYYLLVHRISAGIADGFFPTVAADVSVYLLLSLIAFVVLVFCNGKSKLLSTALIFLLVNTIAISLALYAKRIDTDYAVLYAYGARGTQDVVEKIEPGSRVFISEGMICPPLRVAEVSFVNPGRPDRAEDVIASLTSADPDYIVTGITIDTLTTLTAVYGGAPFLEYVKGRYRRVEIGSYVVWIKNGREP